MSRPATSVHVLHVIDGLGFGGAERMLVDLANRTVADGGTVSVCVTRQEVSRVPELDPRVRVLVLNRRTRLSPAEALRLARWTRSNGVDVIHSHMRSSTAFVTLLRALRLIDVPIVFHDHYGGIEIDTSVPRWFRLGRRFIGHYVGVHERLCQWARDAGMPPARVELIPNGIDLARFDSAAPTTLRAELHLDAATRLGIAVATIRRDKGIEVLLNAVARSRHRDRIHIAIAGAKADEAYWRECHDLRGALGLDRVVSFLGARKDVPGLLREATFAMLSSHSESGPLVLLEYFAAALPVVSTRVGDIGRTFAAMGIPGFVAPRDIDAFTSELDTLLGLSAEERLARGQLGRQHLSKSWDIRAGMPRWYDIYRQMAR